MKPRRLFSPQNRLMCSTIKRSKVRFVDEYSPDVFFKVSLYSRLVQYVVLFVFSCILALISLATIVIRHQYLKQKYVHTVHTVHNIYFVYFSI
jgi:hypothetical protein